MARRRRQNGRRLVNHDQIVSSAIALGDESGLENLTLRELAEELGIGTMTLYSYFQSKDELLDAMADRLLGALTISAHPGMELRGVVRAVAYAYRDLFRRHPSAVRLLAMRATKNRDDAAGGMNETLGALRNAGLDGRQAVRAMGVIVHYTLGFSAYQIVRPWGALDADPELIRTRALHYESQNSTSFPHVVEMAAQLVELPSDVQFEFGVETLAAGLVSMLGESSDTVKSADLATRSRV
jgi:AcrR family transcriptional regulator